MNCKIIKVVGGGILLMGRNLNNGYTLKISSYEHKNSHGQAVENFLQTLELCTFTKTLLISIKLEKFKVYLY